VLKIDVDRTKGFRHAVRKRGCWLIDLASVLSLQNAASPTHPGAVVPAHCRNKSVVPDDSGFDYLVVGFSIATTCRMRLTEAAAKLIIL
jgi:hypothetical protein